MVTNGLPPFYATSFTPTTHNHIPPSLSPSLTTLPHPFIAVITGAGKGLGYHISLAYAQAGASGICISSRTTSDLDALETTINEINSTIDVLKIVCDVQDDTSVAALEKSVRHRWGRVDVVLANAGVISNYITPSEDSGDSNLPVDLSQDADWARVLNINLLGTWRVARAFMPLLERTTDGPQTLLVNSSLAAHSVNSRATPVAYNVSKMAVCRLVEHVAADHGGRGVVAIALHPGAVLTPQTQNHKGAVWDQGLPDDEGLAGAMCVWLTREKRDWLSGRYVSCNWDVEELEERRGEIVEGDKLKFRIVL